MLAKMWKKVLLAVCIIACIYNVMSKLVNRHSLESNLKSANDGNTVIDALREDEKNQSLNETVSSKESENSKEVEAIDGLKNSETNTSANSQESEQKNNSKKSEIDLTNTEELWDSSPREVYRYKDYTMTF